MSQALAALLVVVVCLVSIFADAKVHYVNDLIKQMTASETADVSAILKALKTEQYKDPQTQKMVKRVVAVFPGSAYDRLGVKVGDYIHNGSAPTSGKVMELNSQLKSSTPNE